MANDLFKFAMNRLGMPNAQQAGNQTQLPRFSPQFRKFAAAAGVVPDMLQAAAAARKDPFSPGFQPELSDIVGQKELRRIIASGGLTPAQRDALTRVANRMLAQQAQLANAGLGRRFAAQGIQNTGLANAAVAGIFNQLLGAQQAQQGKLDELSVGILQNAIGQLFGAEQAQAGRRFQEKMAGDPLGRLLGTVLAAFLGKFAGAGGAKAAEAIF